jgi:two-component system cell cycle response regulator
MTKYVLVVDDTVSTVELFREILKMGGFNTFSAYNGLEALEIVRDQHIDCILLDVMMPGIDGISVCKSIKQNPNTKHIPIAIITAYYDDLVERRSFQAGANAFLKKPIDHQDLLEVVSELVERKIKETVTIYRLPNSGIMITNS